MATSCYSASDPPNPETPCVPPSYSLRRQQEADLCHYFGNVRVTVDESSTSSPGSSSYATPTKIQQAQSDFYPRYESGFRNCPRAPMALYSQSIWGGNSVSAGGNLRIHSPNSCVMYSFVCKTFTVLKDMTRLVNF